MLARSLLSVACLSVTRRYCIETDKDIINLFSWPCSPTTVVFYYHIWLPNSNGKGSLSLGWTYIIFGPKTLNNGSAEEKTTLNRHRSPMKVVQLIRN